MNIGLDYVTELVEGFHQAFNHPHEDKPTLKNENRLEKRLSWIVEELVEILYAISEDGNDFTNKVVSFKEAIDKVYVNKLAEGEYTENQVSRLVGIIDGLVDSSYFIGGTFAELGVKPQPFFDIVHEANMSKLFPDGKPRYREEDGKVIKPNTWRAPEPRLYDELLKQMN